MGNKSHPDNTPLAFALQNGRVAYPLRPTPSAKHTGCVLSAQYGAALADSWKRGLHEWSQDIQATKEDVILQ